MRKLSILLVVLLLDFSASQIFAQQKTKLREVIVVEFLIPNRNAADKAEIPLNDKSGIGGGSIDECGIPGQCPGHIYSSYDFSAKAFEKGNLKTKVNFSIKVTDGCKTQKIFTVYRNKKTKLQLNCGVSLVAYYGFETKEAN